MSDGVEREMTLEEWVNRLPDIHLAHKQYQQLREQVEEEKKNVVFLENMADVRGEENQQLKDQLSKYREVVEAAIQLMSFDRAQYIYDKEVGNLSERSPEAIAILEALSQLKDEDDGA